MFLAQKWQYAAFVASLRRHLLYVIATVIYKIQRSFAAVASFHFIMLMAKRLANFKHFATMAIDQLFIEFISLSVKDTKKNRKFSLINPGYWNFIFITCFVFQFNNYFLAINLVVSNGFVHVCIWPCTHCAASFLITSNEINLWELNFMNFPTRETLVYQFQHDLFPIFVFVNKNPYWSE